ncbi:hypothetical protein FHX33_002735 [Leifsonia aquatica]|uniref:Uncharacterized protein n=1 Tax=Leifsonia aquatica TaxID=144185 RepID=A0A7W4UXB2_LEIAQ|nr:hypothetical protein [Leifsonia aquatica]
MFSKAKDPVQHSESYMFGQRKIEVKCTCPIGHDHSHEEWLQKFAALAL